MRFVCGDPDCRACGPGVFYVYDSVTQTVWTEPKHEQWAGPDNFGSFGVEEWMRMRGFRLSDPDLDLPEGM